MINNNEHFNKHRKLQFVWLTILELVLDDHIGGELANVNALHICLQFVFREPPT